MDSINRYCNEVNCTGSSRLERVCRSSSIPSIPVWYNVALGNGLETVRTALIISLCSRDSTFYPGNSISEITMIGMLKDEPVM